MKRVAEPELMESKKQALSYSQANFTESNNIFIDTVFKNLIINKESRILDVGCGDGEIPINIIKRKECSITAIDGSKAMLDEFSKKININKVTGIKILNQNINNHTLGDNNFDFIISNSVLHHIQNINLYWSNMIKLVKDKGKILVMDLFRPESESMLQKMLLKYGGSDPILYNDFANSLRAAYTTNEVSEQLCNYKKASFVIKLVSDRHFIVIIDVNNDALY